MIGRDADLDRAIDAIDEGAMLVTITGPAGVGKTTLAAHLVAALRERVLTPAMPGSAPGRRSSAPPVFFADLTHATTAVDIEAAVLRALAQEAAWRANAQLGAVLESLGPAILVLDNFEQVVASAGETVGAWVADVPELQIVATSRERLRLPSEVVLELRPLALPTGDACEGAAVELWTERVRAIDARYVVDGDRAALVAELVRRLDGLPLAIELAAARLGRLSPSDLRAQLDALGLAAGLRAAIDASWALLDATEKKVFAACGAFRGAISLEAIQVVAGVPDAVDAIASLLDKSLLVVGEDRAVTLLETSRVYASEALAAREDRADIEVRHRDFFRAAAVRARVLAERDPRRAQELFDADRANLDAVVRRGRTSPDVADVEAALVVVAALDEARWQDGSLMVHEGYAAAFAPLFAHPRFGDASPDAVVRALVARARVAIWRVDGRDAAEADLERAVAISDRTDDVGLKSLALRFRALAALVRGAAREAHVDAEAALVLARVSDSPWLVCLAEAMLAFVMRFLGQTSRARDLLERSRAGLRALGNDVFALSLGIDLVYVNLDRGDVETARAILERVERERVDLAMPSLPRLEIARGHLALDAGRAEVARAHYLAAGARARELGESLLELVATVGAAVAGLELSCADGARSSRSRDDELDLREALARMSRSGPHLYAGLGESLAGVFHALLGDTATANESLARAASVGQDGFGRVAYELCRAFLEDQGGADAAQTLASIVPHGSLAEIRILAKILGRVRAVASRADTPHGDRPTFTVDREGRWFVTPCGEKVTCGSRPVMRRILVALVDARIAGVEGVRAEAIAEAGWPGERMLPAARKNRLHVMLTRIRDLGLRAAIEAREDGYALAPSVRIDGAPTLPPPPPPPPAASDATVTFLRVASRA